MTDGGLRRVVTGTSPEGRSVVVSDGPVAAKHVGLMPGAEFFYLWGGDKAPAYPDDGREPPCRSWFPDAPGSYRFEVITIPPDATPRAEGLDMSEAIAEAERTLPGLLGAMDKDHPVMHRTDSTDFVCILSGRCDLHLDGGAVVTLAPGDTVVQNGTRHGWHVPYDEPCRMLCVSIGGSRGA
jgi:mannose-6-phosphate isomerase-like protein (cupin superfamily)